MKYYTDFVLKTKTNQYLGEFGLTFDIKDAIHFDLEKGEWLAYCHSLNTTLKIFDEGSEILNPEFCIDSFEVVTRITIL